MAYAFRDEITGPPGFLIDCQKAGIIKSRDPMLWHLASTGDKDEEGENIHQPHLDIEYLPRDGKLTWGHSPRDGSPIDPENILGNIVAAKLIPEGLLTHTHVMMHKSRAARVYEDYDKAPRGIVPYRASIEGTYKHAFDENGMVQKSAIVVGVALDRGVINTITMGGVLKALSGERPCTCLKSLQPNQPTREKIKLLVDHLVFCRGIDNLQSIRRILKLTP